MGFFHISFGRTMMTPCHLLRHSDLLPAYLIVQLGLWLVLLWLSKPPTAQKMPQLPIAPIDNTFQQSLLRKGLFSWSGSAEKQVLAMFIILENKDKFKEIRGWTWQSTGCSCWPSCAMILNWSITSKTQLFSAASLVQHSCRSNIFGNSHYFRNECSCVFIANHMPALSTIKEIKIQQTYSSN